mmetsp:Transcript_7973/g.15586  ORF Transcript_7973/g.15586 Transcript_7973/m.15586 type:complete len:283 (+) Transcript_7973:2725-3573(+)
MTMFQPDKVATWKRVRIASYMLSKFSFGFCHSFPEIARHSSLVVTSSVSPMHSKKAPLNAPTPRIPKTTKNTSKKSPMLITEGTAMEVAIRITLVFLWRINNLMGRNARNIFRLSMPGMNDNTETTTTKQSIWLKGSPRYERSIAYFSSSSFEDPGGGFDMKKDVRGPMPNATILITISMKNTIVNTRSVIQKAMCCFSEWGLSTARNTQLMMIMIEIKFLKVFISTICSRVALRSFSTSMPKESPMACLYRSDTGNRVVTDLVEVPWPKRGDPTLETCGSR